MSTRTKLGRICPAYRDRVRWGQGRGIEIQRGRRLILASGYGRPAARNVRDRGTKKGAKEGSLGSRESRTSVLDGAQDCVGAGEGPSGKKLKIVVVGGIVLEESRGALPQKHAVVVLGAEVGHVITTNPFDAFASQSARISGELEREGLGRLARIGELEDAGDQASRGRGEGQLLENRNVVLHANANASLRFAQKRNDRVGTESVSWLAKDLGDVLILGVNPQQKSFNRRFSDTRGSIDKIRRKDYVGVEEVEELSPAVGRERLRIDIHQSALKHQLLAARQDYRAAVVAIVRRSSEGLLACEFFSGLLVLPHGFSVFLDAVLVLFGGLTHAGQSEVGGGINDKGRKQEEDQKEGGSHGVGYDGAVKEKIGSGGCANLQEVVLTVKSTEVLKGP